MGTVMALTLYGLGLGLGLGGCVIFNITARKRQPQMSRVHCGLPGTYNCACICRQKTAYFIFTSDQETDRFSFILRLPESFGVGSELEFAIRFDAGDAATYWDNNSGENYRVVCLTRASFASPSAGCTNMSPLRPWQQLI